MEQAGYSLGPVVGEGSSGKVRACKLGSVSMAVKIISKKQNKHFTEREVDIMSTLHHENIIQIHEVVETSSDICIVMELAENGDLLDKVMNTGLSTEEVKKAFSELVSAVKYCHEQNIVHRDLKLENILISKSGQVKVADFGFSRTVEDLAQTSCGSKSYASPELLQGQTYDAKKADIWSLGVVLYAMVCGSLPFDDSNVRRMVEQQLTKSIPFPKNIQVDSDCKELICTMLEPDVTKRATLNQLLVSDYLN